MFNNRSDPILNNVVFDGNTASNNGGGMYNKSSNPVLVDTDFVENSASNGGGVYNQASSPTFTNVDFVLNTVSGDGGGMCNNASNPVMVDTDFVENSASNGGGIYNDASSPTFTNVDFVLNTVSGDGGGMYNNNASDATLINITFGGDTAASGGGVYNNVSNPTLTNVTFAGETATSGGALFNLSSNPELNNLTFGGNYATTGGGLYNDNSLPSIQNSILWGNTDSSGSSDSAQIFNNFSTPNINHSLVQGSGGSGPNWVATLGNDGGGNLDADPVFIRNPYDGGDGWGVGDNDDYGDLRVQAGSPAINAGDNGLLPRDITDLDDDGNTSETIPYDLNNNSRILDGIVDMGAFEVHNEPPIISGTQTGQTVDDNATIDPFTTVTIADPDGVPLSVTVNLDDPAKGTLTNLTGFVEGPTGTYTFLGTPAEATNAIRGLTFDPTENRVPAGETETTTFTINADDGVATPVSDNTTTVVATSINDPPTINGAQAGQTTGDNASINPFTTVTIADPDSATITVTVSLDDPAKGTLTNLGGFVEGPAGTYTFGGAPAASTTAIRDLTFDPTENLVPVGENVTSTLTISADDGQASLVTDASTNVVVTSINDDPTAVDDGYSAEEDTPLTIVAPGILYNDDDLDGDSLSVSNNSQPPYGSIDVYADGSFTYRPDTDFFGVDTYTYTVSDGNGGFDTATVTITVTAGLENDPPEAVDDTSSTSEDTPVNVAVMDNDSDPDGDNLSVTEVTQPADGSAVIDPDDTITYSPDPNFFGVDSFTYTICDDRTPSLCDSATVTITVTASLENDPPVAVDDTYSTAENIPLSVPTPGVLVNDIDVDGDNLVVEDYSQAVNGTVVMNPNGSFTYTPNPEFFGVDSFTYTVSDGNGGSDTATVTVTVDRVTYEIFLPLIYN